MKTLLYGWLVSAFTIVCAIVIYDRIVVGPAKTIGVVDVGDVYRAKEAEFTALLTQSKSDEDRSRAMRMARDFSQRLPAALDELSNECKCLVLIKSAVASHAPRTVDLTEQLKTKVMTP